jgi:hypothetical protein
MNGLMRNISQIGRGRFADRLCLAHVAIILCGIAAMTGNLGTFVLALCLLCTVMIPSAGRFGSCFVSLCHTQAVLLLIMAAKQAVSGLAKLRRFFRCAGRGAGSPPAPFFVGVYLVLQRAKTCVSLPVFVS